MDSKTKDSHDSWLLALEMVALFKRSALLFYSACPRAFLNIDVSTEKLGIHLNFSKFT
ncbi:UNVERIFIED_CONTAM: hypothetical protein LBW93_04220 [Wolbachia endosymbiont of Nasonia longicornis]